MCCINILHFNLLFYLEAFYLYTTTTTSDVGLSGSPASFTQLWSQLTSKCPYLVISWAWSSPGGYHCYSKALTAKVQTVTKETSCAGRISPSSIGSQGPHRLQCFSYQPIGQYYPFTDLIWMDGWVCHWLDSNPQPL